MPGRGPRLVAAITLVLAVTGAGEAATSGHVRIAGQASAAQVARTLAGARRRLGRPACQRIFSDYRDRAGHPLQDALERLGTSGEQVLDSLIFYDAVGGGRCAGDRTLAFTYPGSVVVFVCMRQFSAYSLRDPVVAEAALIHESLHTLGLDDDRPTSAAITSRVIARCGH